MHGKPLRLKRRAEFLRVAAHGKRAAMPGLVLQALPRPDAGPTRIGFTCTRKIGNAVVRNRIRRRLKEAARLALGAAPERLDPGRFDSGRFDLGAVDLVLIGRAAGRTRPFAALCADLRRALVKTGVA